PEKEAVSTDRLVDELWGPRPPASAAKLVATYVWQLRKTLGETIVTRSPGYAAVVSPDQLDTAPLRRPGRAGARLRSCRLTRSARHGSLRRARDACADGEPGRGGGDAS